MPSWADRLHALQESHRAEPEARVAVPLTLPANHPEPCLHHKVFIRANGSRLCVQCWQGFAPGSTTWAPEPAPARCADAQHTPYPEHPSMPGIRQCKHCLEVWTLAVNDGEV